jgi:LPXTG-motif cell wall-anchored protein
MRWRMIRVALSVAGVFGFLVMPGLPAEAAPAAPHLHVTDVAVPVTDHPVSGAPQWMPAVATFPPGPTPVHRFVVEFGNAENVLALSADDPEHYSCFVSNYTVLYCTSIFNYDTDDGVGLLPLVVAARAGAVVGATATLSFRLEVEGRVVARDSTRITVGASAGLTADAPVALTAVPGRTIGVPLGVTNAATAPAAGAVVFLRRDRVLSPDVTQYSNCLYGALDGRSVACVFDTVLDPGAGYRTSEPLSLTLLPETWAPNRPIGQVAWLTRAQWTALQSSWRALGLPLGSRGSGAPLALTPREATTALRGNITTYAVRVTGDNRSDFTVSGAQVAGMVGSTVTATLTLANAGPALLNSKTADYYPELRVTIPDGAKMIRMSPRCLAVRAVEVSGKPGQFFCGAPAEFLPGDDYTFPFTLRLDRKLDHATGLVELVVFNEAHQRLTDTDPAGNQAVLVVTAIAAQAGGTGGGTLPITGTDTGRWTLAGGLLVMVGAALTAMGRRRRN